MKGDTETGDATNGYIGTPGNVPVSHAGSESAMRRIGDTAIGLRVVATLLCVVSLVTMVTDKQTHDYVLPLSSGSITISKTAKYSSVLALVVYVYTNAVVAGYCLLQAILAVLARGLASSKLQLRTTFILDQLVVYVLLGVVGATTEVAYIAEHGEDKVTWSSQCHNYGRFCTQVGASVIICFFGILTLALIAAISAKQAFTSEHSSQTTKKEGY